MKKVHEVENPVWITRTDTCCEVRNEAGDLLHRSVSRQNCLVWCRGHNCQPVARIRAKKLSVLRLRYNSDMADKALEAMRDYGRDAENSMLDLLCDMMHLASREKFDFDDLVRQARVHYLAEMDPDDELANDGARLAPKERRPSK